MTGRAVAALGAGALFLGTLLLARGPHFALSPGEVGAIVIGIGVGVGSLVRRRVRLRFVLEFAIAIVALIRLALLVLPPGNRIGLVETAASFPYLDLILLGSIGIGGVLGRMGAIAAPFWIATWAVGSEPTIERDPVALVLYGLLVLALLSLTGAAQASRPWSLRRSVAVVGTALALCAGVALAVTSLPIGSLHATIAPIGPVSGAFGAANGHRSVFARSLTLGQRFAPTADDALRVWGGEGDRVTVARFTTYDGRGWLNAEGTRDPSVSRGNTEPPRGQREIELLRPGSPAPLPLGPIIAANLPSRLTAEAGLSAVGGEAAPHEARAASRRYREAIHNEEPPEDLLSSTPPPPTTDRVRALAAELTADLTAADAATAVEGYLRTLRYSNIARPAPAGIDAVDWFLFETHAGYCDYFASAMVVLLRAAGHPARLAAGYVGGRGESDGARVFRESDAHSWPELFIPSVGWVPFEPTPSRGPPVRSGDEQLALASVWHSATVPTVAGIALVFGVGAAFLRLVVGLPLGGASPDRMGYVRLVRLARLVGLAPREAETPREFTVRLGAAVPEVATPAAALAAAFVAHRWSAGVERVTIDPGDAWRSARAILLRAAWRRLVRRSWRGMLRPTILRP